MSYTRITMHDIAKRLNISCSAVSRTLNDYPRISEVTMIKVKNMARKMNYCSNTMASNLRGGKSWNTGIIVPCINRFFYFIQLFA